MLIDLEFDDQLLSTFGREGDVVVFDKSNGGLKVKVSHPDKDLFEYTFAERERQGIYWDDLNLHGPIEDWTKYELIHSHDDPDLLERLDALEQKVSASPENEMREKAFHAEIARQHGGTADNLDQILALGRELIESQDPCVLGIHRVTQEEYPSARWHKMGQYVGEHTNLGHYLSDTPEIKEIIRFDFYRLILKAQEESEDNDN